MDINSPIINLKGIKAGIGPLNRAYTDLYYKWNNDFLINRTTASMRPVTLEEQIEAYEIFSKNKNYIFFTIYDVTSLNPIGLTYLSNIYERNAEFNIVIGESEYHGQGYGTEVTQLVLDYAFSILGIHNVMLTVYEYNEAGLKAYKKAGFKENGRRREVKFYNGKLWDQIYMDCISTDFKGSLVKQFISK